MITKGDSFLQHARSTLHLCTQLLKLKWTHKRNLRLCLPSSNRWLQKDHQKEPSSWCRAQNHSYNSASQKGKDYDWRERTWRELKLLQMLSSCTSSFMLTKWLVIFVEIYKTCKHFRYCDRFSSLTTQNTRSRQHDPFIALETFQSTQRKLKPNRLSHEELAKASLQRDLYFSVGRELKRSTRLTSNMKTFKTP